MTQDEKQLLESLHRKDRYACNEMVAQFSGKIYNVALRLTQHPNEAEEVLQETFIKACQHVEDFEGRSSLGTWLYRIATNNSLMRLRRPTPQTIPIDSHPTDETDDFKPQDLQDWAWEPESVLLTDELRVVMQEAVETLPEKLRSVFVLRDLEGLSTAKAAEVLQLSPANLKVRLHRARLLLREYLAAHFAQQKETKHP